jgi:hypothetical protein
MPKQLRFAKAIAGSFAWFAPVISRTDDDMTRSDEIVLSKVNERESIVNGVGSVLMPCASATVEGRGGVATRACPGSTLLDHER